MSPQGRLQSLQHQLDAAWHAYRHGQLHPDTLDDLASQLRQLVHEAQGDRLQSMARCLLGMVQSMAARLAQQSAMAADESAMMK